MSEEATTTETPPEAPASSVELTEAQLSVLREHNIEVPEDGRIPVSDHLRLLNTLSSLREKAKNAERDAEQARLAGLSEADRKIEEAKAQARAEVEGNYKRELTKAQVRAEAAAQGFLDPADAFGMIPDFDAIDGEEAVKKAVGALAMEKPYLIKKASAPKLEGGQQSPNSAATEQTANEWLRGVFQR